MKKKIKRIYIILRSTILVLILLELVLGVLYDYNDNKNLNKKVETLYATGVFGDLELKAIKKIHQEIALQDMQWEPFLHFSLKEMKGKYTNVDNYGHRVTYQKDNKNKKEMKIFCFGGSTLFGLGARDNYTIPSEFSKLIHQKFQNSNIKVTNFGCHGYNRTTENIQLQQELLKGNIPDIVVFYDGVNEVISALENNATRLPVSSQKRKSEFKLAHSYSKRIKLFFTSSHINRFIIYLQRHIFKTKSFEAENPEKLSKAIAQNYINNLKITHGLAQEYNFKVFNFLQPVIFTKSQLTEVEKTYAKQSFYYKDLYTTSYSNIKKDGAIMNDSTFIDISHVFNNSNKTIYTDFCHTGEYGNALVAEQLFNSIKKGLEVKVLKIMNTQKEQAQNSL